MVSIARCPWAFKDFANGIDLRGKLNQEKPTAHRPQLHALLHLVFPHSFEGMVSVRHKETIAKTRAFTNYINEPTDDVDKKIAQIREGLERKIGRDFDFYHHDIQVKWNPDFRNWDVYVQRAKEYLALGTLETDEIGYKREMSNQLSAARESVLAGDSNWRELVKGALSKGNVVDWRDVDNFNRWCSEHGDQALNALKGLWAEDKRSVGERAKAFSYTMPPKVISGRGIRMSLISALLMALDVEQYPPFKITAFNKAYDRTGYDRPEPEAYEAELYVHALGFLDRFIEEAKQRGVVLRHRLDAQSVMWQIQGDTPDDQFEEYDLDDVPEQGLAELAEKTYLTQEFLENIQTLLEDKKQVIFQGPPGTGKTFVAKKLAELLAGSRERVTLVQFHPSYAYEDFVRGFRPRLNDGDARYELWDGRLLKAAERARKKPDIQHFLVIDEINRGNIGKVFGELYFLLEYRDESITLQYQRVDDETFSLPENLYIIGTMNTADRSIALVDMALRRRFYFVEFHPDEEPVKGVLRRWLEANGKSDLTWVADVVIRANELLEEDRHAAIGPSYFMKPELDETMVERIWRHSVIPYIEERLFGGDEVSQEFNLDNLKTYVQSSNLVVDVEISPDSENGAPNDASD